MYDHIPSEDAFVVREKDASGMMTAQFYAFNTVVTLQVCAEEDVGRVACIAARDRCRFFERKFSRTLPHSDIAQLNAAGGVPIKICQESYDLLHASQHYCEQGCGLFDITMGSVVRLWDFPREIIPSEKDVEEALTHVDWRSLVLSKEAGCYWAQLNDPKAALDVGGIAKGFIADELTTMLVARGLKNFIVNLGGNVFAQGMKQGHASWMVGLQDPHRERDIVGAIALRNASAVTSGIYERCFTKDGRFYHHILDPKTGFPVATDVAGVHLLLCIIST